MRVHIRWYAERLRMRFDAALNFARRDSMPACRQKQRMRIVIGLGTYDLQPRDKPFA
jgi:hypothetical protein